MKKLAIGLLIYLMLPLYADVKVVQVNNENQPYSYLGNSVSLNCEYSEDSDNSQISNFEDCKISYSNQEQIKSFTTPQNLDIQTSLVWYNEQYAAINGADGTGTSGQIATIIFNFKNMTHTPVIANFIALDPKRGLIAINGQYVDANNKVANLQKILITGLYDHSKGVLISFPPDADVSMIADPDQSKFDEQGNLVLNYSTTDFDTNTTTLPVDTSKFVPLGPSIINALGLNFSSNS